ncbi:unnamed protein product [Mycena citricolor]|uniref:Uncharacterized protein n=1 Tax=Mycena citricolor TaxID=2018698 RepID=A0AAD2HPF3_9AGAR|nr:unnamed protein product [Mycena citricolor]
MLSLGKLLPMAASLDTKPHSHNYSLHSHDYSVQLIIRPRVPFLLLLDSASAHRSRDVFWEMSRWRANGRLPGRRVSSSRNDRYKYGAETHARRQGEISRFLPLTTMDMVYYHDRI